MNNVLIYFTSPFLWFFSMHMTLHQWVRFKNWFQKYDARIQHLTFMNVRVIHCISLLYCIYSLIYFLTRGGYVINKAAQAKIIVGSPFNPVSIANIPLRLTVVTLNRKPKCHVRERFYKVSSSIIFLLFSFKSWECRRSFILGLLGSETFERSKCCFSWWCQHDGMYLHLSCLIGCMTHA